MNAGRARSWWCSARTVEAKPKEVRFFAEEESLDQVAYAGALLRCCCTGRFHADRVTLRHKLVLDMTFGFRHFILVAIVPTLIHFRSGGLQAQIQRFSV